MLGHAPSRVQGGEVQPVADSHPLALRAHGETITLRGFVAHALAMDAGVFPDLWRIEVRSMQ